MNKSLSKTIKIALQKDGQLWESKKFMPRPKRNILNLDDNRKYLLIKPTENQSKLFFSHKDLNSNNNMPGC